MVIPCSLMVAVTLSTPAAAAPEYQTYTVRKIAAPLTITGKGDDPQWNGAAVLSSFTYPWEGDKSCSMRFRALHDETWFYALFEVDDPHVYLYRPEESEKRHVINSSRAEIFFRRDAALSPYYCLEIDPLGRVYDYEARYHRTFDATWAWPSGQCVVKTYRHPGGYTVELAISKSSLRQLGLLQGDTLQAGLYRADSRPEPGNTEPDFSWASWVRPESETPDFHIPSSFGILQLQ